MVNISHFTKKLILLENKFTNTILRNQLKVKKPFTSETLSVTANNSPCFTVREHKIAVHVKLSVII